MNRVSPLLRAAARCGFHRTAVRPFAGAIPVDDVLMGLSDDHIELRSMARNFFEAELLPFANDIDKNDDFPQFREFWQKCGEMGMHGITAPEEYGGTDMGYLAHVLIMEEMSRVAGGIALSYGAHSNLCVNQLVRNGTPEQKEQYLPKLISGEHVGNYQLSFNNWEEKILSPLPISIYVTVNAVYEAIATQNCLIGNIKFCLIGN